MLHTIRFEIRVIRGLIRELLSGPHDPYVMIRKTKVRCLDLDLGHVTRRAILIGNRTTRSVTCLHPSRLRFQ